MKKHIDVCFSKTLVFDNLNDSFNNDNYYTRPNDFGDEGVDHVNINYLSTTELGRVLTLGFSKVIDYPLIGKFSSVNNLWYWIRSDNLDDSIRRLSGRNLKQYAIEHNLHKNHINNYKAILGYATWLKIKNIPSVINNIKELSPDVKYLCYNTVSGSNLRICNNQAFLITSISSLITEAIKKETVPDFSIFTTNKKSSNLYFLDYVLKKALPCEKIEELKKRHRD